LIVVKIGDLRIVQLVITAIVVSDQGPETIDSFYAGFFVHAMKSGFTFI
jgi:hypothetical protein